MNRQVYVVGHADADGHLITTQVCRNLSKVPGFEVFGIVNAELTKNHKTWFNLRQLPIAEDADMVFFMDLMFAPSSFLDEAKALMQFIKDRPKTRFFVMDHHPLPLGRLVAPNLRAIYRDEVSDCTFGPRSVLMEAAALCEKQPTRVKADPKRASKLMPLATAIQRAAIPKGPLAGERLMALMHAGQWRQILALNEEPADVHPRPRGLRPANAPESKRLTSLTRMADKLLGLPSEHAGARAPLGAQPMAYDAEVLTPDQLAEVMSLPPLEVPKLNGRDLEVIMTMLELAAMELTPQAGATFTKKALLDKAREYAGDSVELLDSDVKIVLNKNGFLEDVAGGMLRVK